MGDCDKEIAIAAVSNQYDDDCGYTAFSYISESLQNDKDVVLATISKSNGSKTHR